MTHRALQSLYGKGDAVRRAPGRRSSPGTSTRPQEVYTSQPIIDGILRLWPEGIALDPCGGPRSIVPAARSYFVPGRRRGDKVTYVARAGEEDGLALPWCERTYCNMPFGLLQRWLEKAAGEPDEQILLAPVRTQRNWFLDALELADQTIWLDDVRFLGFRESFPAPLCLLYRGERDAAAAFAELGREVKLRHGRRRRRVKKKARPAAKRTYQVTASIRGEEALVA